MSGEELRAARERVTAFLARWDSMGGPLDRSTIYSLDGSDNVLFRDDVALLAAPSTPEPYDPPIPWREPFGGSHPYAKGEGGTLFPSTPEPSGLLTSEEIDAGFGRPCGHVCGIPQAEHRHEEHPWASSLRAAPSTEPALDVERQFAAVDKSLLATFQWSDTAYAVSGLAATAFLKHLHDIGWDVTVSDPEKAAKYARLAASQPSEETR